MNKMDIASILVLSMCVLLPYIGIMTIIAVVSYRAKLKSANKLLEYYKTGQLNDQLQSKLSARIKIYIIIIMALLGSLACLMIVVIGNYLSIPWVPHIDKSLIGEIFISAFIF